MVPVQDITDVLSPPVVARHGIYTFPRCPSPNQPNYQQYPPVQLSLPLTILIIFKAYEQSNSKFILDSENPETSIATRQDIERILKHRL